MLLEFLSCMCTSPCFPTSFTKDKQLIRLPIFVPGQVNSFKMDQLLLQKRISSSRSKEFAPRGVNSSLSGLTSTEKGGQNENSKVSCPLSVCIYTCGGGGDSNDFTKHDFGEQTQPLK